MIRHDALLKGKLGKFITTADVVREKTVFSLGPLSLNLAIGNARGVESGRFVQIFGKPSVGKSTLVMDIIRQWQEVHADNDALYVDFERALDARYINAIGVDLSRLLVVRADTTEQGQNIIEQAIESGIKLIVVDSIAAGVPSSELDKRYDESPKMASGAGLWTRFALRMIPRMDNNDVLVILINQMRKNFSMMSRDEEIPWGGLALQYASSVNVHLQRIETKNDHIGVRATIKKNKVGSPMTTADFDIAYGQGIRHDLDVLTLAQNAGIIGVNGSWYSYGQVKAQGIEGAAATFPVHEIKEVLLGAQYA